MNNHGVYFPDTNRGQALSGKQLLQVAETLGQEWRRAGVYLELSTTDLDDIMAGEADVTMQKLKMLELWKRRTPSEATAQDLLRGLQALKDLPVGTRQLLRGNLLAGSQEVKASYKVSPTETKGRTSELLLSSEQFKTEKLKDRDNIYAVMAPANRTRMALLITNVHFDKVKDRDGAEKDEEDMSKLLISLGYNVEQQRDLSGVEMDEAVKRFSKDPRLAATDSVFVVIMSHGVKGAILGVHHCDGVPDQFPIDNIYKHLDSARCPKLFNKPKVIIIQACRGVDDGSAIVCDGPGSVPEQAPVVQVDAALPPHLADEVDADIEEDAIHRVHKEKDMVSFLSSTADTVSFRHSQQGSYFIQHLVEIFNLHAHEDHIEKLFKRVLKRFEDEPPSADRRQMAVKERCTLIRDFYLFPGL
ncbi:caspase-13-like isoform X2 [Gadus morhua]|uniref:caspase-13-like isoform X2 n=1 Tax=Gadus morhua TaxID=8049 RepID=UPI0011B4A480|nr:caspase-13-like isoform X2 [Gadus morhua]